MRRGVIYLGNVECDGCQRIVPYAERYMIVDEEDSDEVESCKKLYYCVDCCLEKGYAHYREEKGEKVLTFFPSEIEFLKPGGEETDEQAADNE